MRPMIDVHTHAHRGGAVELLSVQTPNAAEGFCSQGVHPWRADLLTDEALTAELEMVARADIAAVGECGLDAAKGRTQGWPMQLRAFREQVAIAKQRGLPIIIHSVRAFEECAKILEGAALTSVVFHSWIGSAEQATRAIRRGWMLSIGPRSVASSRTAEVVRTLPAECLLAETDDSDTPIELIYKQIAELRGESIATLREIIYNNFTRIWPNGWSEPSCCSEAKN